MSLPWKTLLPRYLLLRLVVLVVLGPLSGALLSAFKTVIEVIQGPFSLPENWRLDNLSKLGRSAALIYSSKTASL